MGEKKELQVLNVLDHMLVPKMEVLSDSQKKKVLEEYSVTGDQFPKINQDDPAVVALGAKEGDLIRIHRKDPTAKYIYYRIVV